MKCKLWWARYWNGDTDGSPIANEETVTTFAVPWSDTWLMPDGTSQSGKIAQVGTKLDAATYLSYDRIYFVGTAGTNNGWQRGLPALVNTYDGSNILQRQVMSSWTQDSTSSSYPLNPRVSETNIYDPSGNRKRTRITYLSASFSDGTSCQLPENLYEYQANATTVLRRTYTDYNLSTVYTDKHIIGLVSEKDLFEIDPNTLAETLMSKFSYQYDETGSIQGSDAPVQHDNTNFNASFVSGRANVSSIKRYDVTNTSQFTQSTIRYNTAGAVVASADALNHATTTSYSDSFSDSNNSRNTLAYPTTVTDPDGYSSSSKYNFDFGAVTQKQTPLPNVTTNTPGPVQTFEYDEIGRLRKTNSLANSAYTRFIYGPNYVQTWSTVNTATDEALSLQVFDGAGRVIAKASNHPGSTGGYAAQLAFYDIAGRVTQQSNSTETSIAIASPAAVIYPYSWSGTGDDVAANTGYYWPHTTQTFDWKGRPLRTTNQDGTYKEASYVGCGCAGGEVITLTDEVGRRFKVSSDVLSRQWKKELLNWDGSVYSTSVSVFNMRDQVTNIKDYTGTAPIDASSTNAAASCPNPSTTCQETLMAYDGYGRLQTKHVPEQFEGTTIKYSTYSYNTDDTLNSVTNARGAAITYGYNNRHLVTGAVSTLSGSPNISVTYDYDSAGNRTSMSHLVGAVAQDDTSYSYDQLSRLSSETIHINALPSYYTIGYGYTLSNQLSSVVDPFGSPTTITYDQVGRTATVTGTWNGTNYTYANNVSYRAWGAVKSISFNGETKATAYNSRLLPTHYGAYDYSYYDDGKLQEFRDQNDQVGDPQYVQFHYMSRRYSYDQVGRVTSVGQLQNYSIMAPFSGAYIYDAFDNLTSRGGNYALNSQQSDSGTYTNNRRGGWTYNAEGKVTNSTDNSDSGGSSTRAWTYDAAGQLIVTSEVRNGQTTTLATGYDGDGKVIHEVINGTTGDYLIQSSVLGSVLTKLKLNGGKDITYVPANGLVLPMQLQDQPYSSPPSYLSVVSRDPLGIQENKNGYQYAYDPFDNLVSNVQPPSGGPPPYMQVYGATYGGLTWNSFINANNFSQGCKLDGAPASCDDLTRKLGNGELATVTTYVGFNPGSLGLVPRRQEEWKINEWVPVPAWSSIGQSFDEGEPQNSGPTIAFGPKYQDRIQPFKDAFDDAVNRLKTKKNCAKLFGGLDKALDKLNSATYRLFDKPIETTYKDGKFVHSVTGARTAPDNTVFINLSGPFFNGPDLKMSGNRSFKADFGTNLKGNDLAALLLLHELGHQVGKWGSDAGIGDKDKNLAHSMAVKDACF